MIALIVGAVLLLLCGLIAMSGSHARNRIALLNRPPSPLGTLEPGVHRIRALVTGAGSTRSPLTEQDCVLFELHLEKKVSGGENDTHETLAKRSECVPLRLQDASGGVDFEPEGAEFFLENAHAEHSHPLRTAPSNLDRLLADYGARGEEGRCREGVVLEGTTLTVLGPVIRGESGHLKVCAGTNREDFLISSFTDEVLLNQLQTHHLLWRLVAIGLGIGGVMAMIGGALMLAGH